MDNQYEVLSLSYSDKEQAKLLKLAINSDINFHMVFHMSGKDFYIPLTTEQIIKIWQSKPDVVSFRLTNQQLLENHIFHGYTLERYLIRGKEKEKLTEMVTVSISYLGLLYKKTSIIPTLKKPQDIASSLGSRGGKKANKRHLVAKQRAIELAKKYWSNNPDFTKEDVAMKIGFTFENEKISNNNEPYSPITIKSWISDVVPKEKKKGGRPTKISL